MNLAQAIDPRTGRLLAVEEPPRAPGSPPLDALLRSGKATIRTHEASQINAAGRLHPPRRHPGTGRASCRRPRSNSMRGRILAVLAASPRGLNIGEIAGALDEPTGTILSPIHVMRMSGLVRAEGAIRSFLYTITPLGRSRL